MKNWFFKDNKHVYFFGFSNNFDSFQVKSAKPSEFEAYKTYPWGFDNSHVFWATKAIELENVEAFKPINTNWGKTNQKVIYKNNIVESIDKASFEILNEHYSRDINTVYYGLKILEGCDPKKFKATAPSNGHDGTFFYFQEKNKGELTASQKKIFKVK